MTEYQNNARIYELSKELKKEIKQLYAAFIKQKPTGDCQNRPSQSVINALKTKYPLGWVEEKEQASKLPKKLGGGLKKATTSNTE